GKNQYGVLFIRSISDEPREGLKSVEDGLRQRYGQGVKSRKDITVDGYPGLELIIETPPPSPMAIRYRAVVPKKGAYEIYAMSPKATEASAGLATFVESFKLLKAAATPAELLAREKDQQV